MQKTALLAGASGLIGTHLLPLLLGERAQPRLGEQIATAALRALNPLLRGPLLKYRPVTGATVAAAMLRAAEDDGGGVRVHEPEELAQSPEMHRLVKE